EAGADIIVTNSFGANRLKLRNYGLEDRVSEINRRSAEIAKEAAGEDIYVAGDIGPLGKKVRPFGSIPQEDAYEYFREQAQGLLDGGVDLFICETFTYLNELEQAVEAVKSLCGLPIIALVTVNEEGQTLIGMEPEGFIPIMEDWKVDGIGINCSVGPHALLNAIEKIMEVATLPVIAEPNAGIPRNVEGRNIYLCSPEYISTYAQKYVELGVKMIGGCCGTKGEHIKAMRAATKGLSSGIRTQKVVRKSQELAEVDIVPDEKKSLFAKKLISGEFAVSVELTPPKGWDYSGIIEKSRILHENKIDCVNIPDGPRASARMSPQVLAHHIQREVGIETILHYCCRDRNLLGMQSDILGNYSAGVRNILIITGDPPKMGDYPDATAVFDVDSIGLVQMVKRLNHGADLGNNLIGKPTGYYIGVGLNPNAIDRKREITRFHQKVAAGAEYVITQPVFDIESLLKFLDELGDITIPLLSGIWPLVSLRNATFMKHEVPGVFVPDSIIDRMNKFENKEDALKEGIDIACEILDSLASRKIIQGAQVSAPFGHVEYSLQVIDVVR
ncbi:bifunctional homocysteine S-methyltransferase/methylenetetrahydrofolate reductase, partial [candidate division KSB1 bacterium]